MTEGWRRPGDADRCAKIMKLLAQGVAPGDVRERFSLSRQQLSYITKRGRELQREKEGEVDVVQNAS